MPKCAGACKAEMGICYAKIRGTGHQPWLTALLAWRATEHAAIALANKVAAHGLGVKGQRREQYVMRIR